MSFAQKVEVQELDTQFQTMQVLVWERCMSQFGSTAISQQIMGLLTMALAKEPGIIDDLHLWVETRLSKAIESYFQELRLYCLKHAIEITSNQELAEDIAQESISALLNSKKEITYVKGWLRKTTISMACQNSRAVKKQQKIVQKVKCNPQDLEDPNSITEKHVFQKLSFPEAKKLLSAKDYAAFKKLKQYKTLKEYAEAVGISYQTARERSLILRTNLKAAYFQAKGWDNLPCILDYRQLLSIKHFLHQMVDVFGVARTGNITKNNVRMDREKIYEVFEGVSQIKDWGVTKTAADKFRLTLCDANLDMFALINLNVTINKSNRIILLDCTRQKVDLIYKIPDKMQAILKQKILRNEVPQTAKELDQLAKENGCVMIPGRSLRDFQVNNTADDEENCSSDNNS